MFNPAKLQLKNRLSPKAELRSRGGGLSWRVFEYAVGRWARMRGAAARDVTVPRAGARQSRSRQRGPPRAHALSRQTRPRPSDVNSLPLPTLSPHAAGLTTCVIGFATSHSRPLIVTITLRRDLVDASS